MTLYFVNFMWAIVLFGILLWTTACVALNAALRRGMRALGLVNVDFCGSLLPKHTADLFFDHLESV